MKKEIDKYVSSELIAAYLEGKATASENLMVINALAENHELREIIQISQALDEKLIDEEIDFLPMTAMAASCGEECYCCLECEKQILSKHNIVFNEKELLSDAVYNKWQKQNGTALFNIGRNLEKYGFVLSRRYQCDISDIVESLNNGDDVIVAVDGGELRGNIDKEIVEDLFIGQIPDHTVVVLACEPEQNIIEVFDPDSPNDKDCYSIEQFMNAWADSKNYLVTINLNNMKEYIPNPIDLSDVVLTEDLNELREAIAENAHEIWAENRKAEGWTYGPQRDDKLKQTPDMVPYSKLPESEKEYDRQMAMKTIKLLKKLGYDLIKREDTDLYKVLIQRIKGSKQEYHCRHCGNVIYKHQIFCDNCGLDLKMDWSEK